MAKEDDKWFLDSEEHSDYMVKRPKRDANPEKSMISFLDTRQPKLDPIYQSRPKLLLMPKL